MRRRIVLSGAVGILTLMASRTLVFAQGRLPVPVGVAPVIEQTVAREIQAVGTVEANLYTTVSAEVEGAVARFDLREGDRVEKGQVLAKLRRTDLEIALKEAKANLREKEALFRRAQQDHRRFQALFDEGAISASELDQAAASADAAKALKESVGEAFRKIADELRRTSVVAPFSGYIVKKHVEIGQWVDEGGEVSDLVDIDTVYVLIPINERDIGKIRKGDVATVTVDTYPGRTFKGQITYIIPQADVSSRNFPVKIRVDNSREHLLKAGMFARVSIQYGEPRQGLFIPKDAVVLRGKDRVVFVLDTSRVQLVRVQTGQALGEMVEIVKGNLKPGQEVVVAGNEILQDGAEVEVRRKGKGER
ncbi:MAG: efflux RND transporter periplasmic adaptor subunit [Candidatus Methylomirabilales bacterium]